MRILRSIGSRVCTGLAASVLLLGAHDALAQAVVDVTAAPTNTVTPDGQTVPMWGYTCSVDSTDKTGTTACGAVNPSPSGGGWSPMVIRVQSPASGTGKL